MNELLGAAYQEKSRERSLGPNIDHTWCYRISIRTLMFSTNKEP